MIWKPDGLGRNVAYFGDIEIGAVRPVALKSQPYCGAQWALWLPPARGVHWSNCRNEEEAKAALERAAADWLARASLAELGRCTLEILD